MVVTETQFFSAIWIGSAVLLLVVAHLISILRYGASIPQMAAKQVKELKQAWKITYPAKQEEK